MCKGKASSGEPATSSTAAGIPHSSSPFDEALLYNSSIDASNCSYAEVAETSKVYNLLAAYVLENCTNPATSIAVDVGQASKGVTSKADVLAELKQVKPKTAESTLGLGVFAFQHDGKTLHCLHQRVGAPVGTNCGPKIFTSLVIFVEGDDAVCKDVVEGLINHLLAGEGARQSETFTVFRWHVKYCYWKKDVTVLSRPLSSVVLNSVVKDAVIEDMNEFLEEATLEFYLDHGIPYKRSYLFHGAPGAGKTSLIQALAGKYQRNICYLQPSHPEMTDDSLKEAVQQCPRRSIIVLEDVDALFTAAREGKRSSHLTFSGLLNALDGVGPPLGQIFILTTNHRERLDPALIRNGRVDLHVNFTPATAEQMAQIFLAFYPGEDELATEFSSKLHALLGKVPVSMAAMQHFFIRNRKSTAEEAVGNVEQIPANLKEQADGDDASSAGGAGGSAGAGAADEMDAEAKAAVEKELVAASKTRAAAVFADTLAELMLPENILDALAAEGIEDVETLQFYTAKDLAESTAIKGGHARKLHAHFQVV